MPYFIDRHYILKLHDYVNRKDILEILDDDNLESIIIKINELLLQVNNEFSLVRDNITPVDKENLKKESEAPNIYSESEYHMLLKVLKALLLLKFYTNDLSFDDARIIHGNTADLFSRIILYFSDSLAHRHLISHVEHTTGNNMNSSMLKYIRTSVLAAIRRAELGFKRKHGMKGISLELEDALRHLIRLERHSQKDSTWEKFTEGFPGRYSARVFSRGEWVFEDLESDRGMETKDLIDYFLRLYDPTFLIVLNGNAKNTKYWGSAGITIYKVTPSNDYFRDFKFEEISFTKDLSSRHESSKLLNSIFSSIFHSFPVPSIDPYYDHKIDFKSFFEDGEKGLDKLGGLTDGIKTLHVSLKKLFTNTLKANDLFIEEEHNFKTNPLLKIEGKKSTKYNCKLPGSFMFISKNN